MAYCFITVVHNVFNRFFNLELVSFNKKLQKHLGGVLRRVGIIELIVQSNLSHDEVTYLSNKMFGSTYYAHAASVSTVNYLVFPLFFRNIQSCQL